MGDITKGFRVIIKGIWYFNILIIIFWYKNIKWFKLNWKIITLILYKKKVLSTDMTFHFENVNKTKIRSLSKGK